MQAFYVLLLAVQDGAKDTPFNGTITQFVEFVKSGQVTKTKLKVLEDFIVQLKK